jgi:hypothetical protein
MLTTVPMVMTDCASPPSVYWGVSWFLERLSVALARRRASRHNRRPMQDDWPQAVTLDAALCISRELLHNICPCGIAVEEAVIICQVANDAAVKEVSDRLAKFSARVDGLSYVIAVELDPTLNNAVTEGGTFG